MSFSAKSKYKWLYVAPGKEQKFGDQAGATFRKDGPTYIDLLDISKQPGYKEQDLFDEQMTCFCHD